jgi:dTDP-4-dehydrorhamnose 3,5-epimerase
MKVTQTKISEVLLFEPDAFGDPRGWFLETWRKNIYEQAGVNLPFVQDNVSFSQKNVLRGLHFQFPHQQGKLVGVLYGKVFDAAVDIRLGSPTFGKWVGETLSSDNHKQMYIPPGFAHGFCVLSDTAVFSYKCTDYYNAAEDAGISFSDPDIAIAWPIASPLVSKKDTALPRLKDVQKNKLPVYAEAK